MVYTFTDFYKNKVKLSFDKQPFSKNPKHVWIVCRYNHQWLLTEHQSRGLEFPGGKVEEGETAEQAAYREVMEETGATIETLQYIAQYYVDGKGGLVIKNVYFAQIAELLDRDHYFETKGPVLLDKLPHNMKRNKRFSFMMKDEVVIRTMDYIKQHILTNE